MIDKKEFLELADIHDPHCISVYLPKTGTEKDKIRLRNQLSEIKKVLHKKYGLDERAIKSRLHPLPERSNDPKWWQNQASGISIFRYGDSTMDRFIPFSLEPYTYVADHLYLLPLTPLVHRDQRIYIMTLSAQNVKLFMASWEQIEKSPVSEELPQPMEAVTGTDFEQKSLQYRQGQGESQSGMFHGHGSGKKDERKTEYLKFFREVDRKLLELLENKDLPLVIACVEYLFPIYREASKYPNIYPHPVVGNYDQSKTGDLHGEARAILDGVEKDEQNRKKDLFQQALNERKASYQPEEIIPAVIAGKVDTLFIKKGSDLWGKYNLQTNRVELGDADRIDNISLFNLAAVHTVKNAGNVYIMEGDEMPERDTSMNALYRYTP